MKNFKQFLTSIEKNYRLHNSFHIYVGGMLSLTVQGKSDVIDINVKIIHIQ